MASTKLKTTKDGKRYYEIRVRMGREKATLSMRWYVPDGWSKRSIERELAKVAAEFERQCKSGEHTTIKEKRARDKKSAEEEAKILTVQQYAEQVYLPRKYIVLSERTSESYRWTFQKYIFPAFGDKHMEDVTPAQISSLLSQKQMEKQKISSVVRLYVILNNFFKSARKDGIIVSNPMEMIDRPVPRKDEIKKEAPEFYTEEEVARILSIMQNEPLKWRGYMSVLIDTGIRRGECCGIQWENVDFRNNKIAIKGSLNYTSSRGVYWDTPKGKKERTVYISQGTASLLQEIRESQSNSSKWVFTRDGSTEPMHPDSPTKYMERLSKRAGIENLHPHKLRHTFASIALINGADVVSVSELLGHSDTSVTLRTYAHASEKSKQRAFNTFQDAIHAGIKEDAAADADKTLLKSKSEKPISQHIKEEKLTSSHHKRR